MNYFEKEFFLLETSIRWHNRTENIVKTVIYTKEMYLSNEGNEKKRVLYINIQRLSSVFLLI